MNKLTPYFPLNSKVKKGNIVSLLVVILLYVLVGVIFGFIIGLVSAIPVVNIITGIVCTLFDIYCLIGLILAVIAFL